MAKQPFDSGGGGGGSSSTTTDEKKSTDEEAASEPSQPAEDSGSTTTSADSSTSSQDSTTSSTNNESSSMSGIPDGAANTGPSNDPTPSAPDPNDTPTSDTTSTEDQSDNTDSGGAPDTPDDALNTGPSNDPTPASGGDESTETASPAPNDTEPPSDQQTQSTTEQDSKNDPESTDQTTQQEQRIEQQYAQENEQYSTEDVDAFRGEDGEWRVAPIEEAEQQAQQSFLEENPEYSAEDVEASYEGDGSVEFQLTESGRETWIDENYERGPPESAGGEGIADEGSPVDPLEGTGLERGFGETAYLARDLEREVVEQNEDIDSDDVEVTAEDGKLQVEMAPGTLTEEQAENIDDGRQQDASQLQRENTSGVTPDYTTAAVNEVERQLEEQGVNTENVDINVEVDRGVEQGQLESQTTPSGTSEDGQASIRVEAQMSEGGNELDNVPIYLPSATSDRETAIGEGFEAATRPIFGPLGIDGSDVAGAAADEAGVGGQTFEEVAGSAGDEITQVIRDNAPQGAVALGSIPIAAASSVSDTAGQQASQFYQSTFESGAQVANVPETAIAVKEAGEFAAYGAGETAEGRGGEFVDETEQRAKAVAARAVSQAEANPASAAGSIVGGLVASTASMGAAASVSPRLGAATRYAIQPGEELATGVARRAPGIARTSVSRTADVSSSAIQRGRNRASNSNFLQDKRGQTQVTKQRSESESVDESDVSEWVDQRTQRAEGEESSPAETPETDLREEAEFTDSEPAADDSDIPSRDLRKQAEIEEAQRTVDSPTTDLREEAVFPDPVESNSFEIATGRRRPEWYTQQEPQGARGAEVADDAMAYLDEAGVDGFDTRSRLSGELQLSSEATVRSAVLAQQSQSAEETLAAGVSQQQSTSQQVGQETGVEATRGLQQEFGVEVGQEATVEATQEVGVEVAQEAERTIEQEAVTEPTAETRLDTRLESRTETAIEFVTEGDTRRETQLDLEGDSGDDPLALGDSAEGDEQRYEYESLDLL